MSKLLRAAVIFILFFALGTLCLHLGSHEGLPSLIWLPTGLSMAALVFFGIGVWPIFFFAGLLMNRDFGTPWLASLVFSVAYAAEIISAGFLLKRLRFDWRRLDLKNITSYLAVTCVISPLIAAAIGTLGNLNGGVHALESLTVWWVGDAVGSLVLGLAILSFCAAARWKQPKWSQLGEIFLLALFHAVILYWIFLLKMPQRSLVPRSYFYLPLLVWAAIRYDLLGAALSSMLLLIAGTYGTFLGTSPFVHYGPALDLIYFQTYLVILTTIAYVIAAIFRERQQALSQLADINQNLDLKVQERTRQLIEAQELAHLGNWEYDPSTGRLDWSQELYQIYGLDPRFQKTSFESYLQMIHPDDRASSQAVIQDLIAGKNPSFVTPRRIVRPDGAVRVVQARGRALYDSQGRVIRLAGTCQDITEFYEQEKALRTLSSELEQRVEERTWKLQEANLAKDEFLAILSHELRTPLNVILGWTDILDQKNLTPHLWREGFEALKRNAVLQKKLIDDLLDTSRIIAGKLHLEMQSLDLRKSVRDAIETFAVEISKRQIEIELRSPDHPIWINGDILRISQILTNLMSNAIKFSSVGGKVEVSLRRLEGERAELSVRDYGVGIDPDFLPQVFDRFRQESRGTNRQHEGLGLGLAITQFLARRHHGEIHASSDGKDKGSTFVFTLPTAPAPSLMVPTDAESRAVARLTGHSILLVDDSPDILELLAFWLGSWEAKVYCASSVKDAFEILETQTIDFVFCDIGMPIEDGFDFISRLRQNEDPSMRSLPVSALTAYAQESEHSKIMAQGFDGHLIKPVNPNMLLQAIQKLITLQRSRSVEITVP